MSILSVAFTKRSKLVPLLVSHNNILFIIFKWQFFYVFIYLLIVHLLHYSVSSIKAEIIKLIQFQHY